MQGKINMRPYSIFALPVVMALSLLTFVSGCGSTQIQPGVPQANRLQIEVVARDLLYVMAQILEPNATTFQLGHPGTEFGKELERGFREIGYGMQRVEADQGPNFMTYSESTNVASTGKNTYRYRVFIGDVGLERVYTEVASVGLVPSGPMQVYGTRQSVTLSDLLFPDQSQDIVYRTSDDDAVDESLITVFDDEVVTAIGELRSQNLPRYKTFNSADQEIQNLFTRGSSNFEALGREYRVVRREIIAFGDDSLFLLDKGREQVGNIVKYYKAETDLVRVVGCSNGKTNYKGGNIALAQGRSARVAQELVSRAVDKDNILDEGCWSPESAGDRFPDRGVIIELQRKS